MTFSLLARCPRTGQFGMVISSSSVCVASRCVWLRAGVGAVGTQNITDPRLGRLGLDLLAQGMGAASVRDRLVDAQPFAAYRQLIVLDGDGRSAVHSGARTLGIHATAAGEACAAGGNLLAHDGIPKAMIAGYMAAPEAELAERLVRALEAGLAAGGEAGDEHSAGISVVDRHVWPICDLRVDWHDDPIGELRRVWEIYRPQMKDYLTRALDPTSAPSYGVPGDP
ncbi:MAG: DUF1028 domain-containing protein [Alphaproteobacteria bacterium]|nr:DUF1028 domain-containing protein [Alphaproteobacteria bacterium]